MQPVGVTFRQIINEPQKIIGWSGVQGRGSVVKYCTSGSFHSRKILFIGLTHCTQVLEFCLAMIVFFLKVL